MWGPWQEIRGALAVDDVFSGGATTAMGKRWRRRALYRIGSLELLFFSLCPGSTARPSVNLAYLLSFFAWIFSIASFSAVARASAAGTFTSGSTPVPSQLVLVIGSGDFANGTPIVK